jgi:hypothetical protein
VAILGLILGFQIFFSFKKDGEGGHHFHAMQMEVVTKRCFFFLFFLLFSFFIIIINIGVRVNFRTFRLISRVLKLTTI